MASTKKKRTLGFDGIGGVQRWQRGKQQRDEECEGGFHGQCANESGSPRS